MAVITGLVSSCYILMLILTVVHCNEKKSWTTLKGNHSSSLGENDLSYSQDGFLEEDVQFFHGTSLNKFSLSCLMEGGANSCPPWMYCDNGTCKCGDISHSILRCDDNRPGKVSVLDCYCLTYNEEEHTNELGHCIFNCIRNVNSTDVIYHLLPNNVPELNDFMCEGFNKEGTLCGKCKENLYPIANSFDMKCIKCDNRGINWLRYILVSFLPLTIFCFIVFKISANSFHLHGFILFCQAISVPSIARVLHLSFQERSVAAQYALEALLSLCGIWNLDFFRFFDLSICLGTGTLPTLALDIAVGVYPLLLTILSYIMIHLYDRNFLPLVILWRPFKIIFGLFRRDRDIKTSVIDSYATFFLLSSMKLMSACFDLLVPTSVYQLNNSSNTYKTELRLFYDSSIVYNGPSHRPYFILAIGVLFIFVILPVMILMLYPFQWFQKILNLFPVRWYVLHTFVDSLQGFYKNGTEPGTRDCRWFASVFFIIRLFLLIESALTLGMSFFVFGAMTLTILIILMIVIQPYKEDRSHYSIINTMFIIILAIGSSCILGDHRAVFKKITDIISHVFWTCVNYNSPSVHDYMTVVVLYWAWRQRALVSGIIRRVCALRSGYELLE